MHNQFVLERGVRFGMWPFNKKEPRKIPVRAWKAKAGKMHIYYDTSDGDILGILGIVSETDGIWKGTNGRHEQFFPDQESAKAFVESSVKSAFGSR